MTSDNLQDNPIKEKSDITPTTSDKESIDKPYQWQHDDAEAATKYKKYSGRPGVL